MEDTENSPHLSNYYYFFKSPFGRIYYLKWLFWLLTWCEASWISLITVLLSFLSGQETTMKPAKLRSHSRASRLISRTCTETRRSNSLSLLLFSSLHNTRTGSCISLAQTWEYLLVAQVSHLLVPQRQNSSSFTGHLFVHFVVVGWTLWKLEQTGVKGAVCNFRGTDYRENIGKASLLKLHRSCEVAVVRCSALGGQFLAQKNVTGSQKRRNWTDRLHSNLAIRMLY